MLVSFGIVAAASSFRAPISTASEENTTTEYNEVEDMLDTASTISRVNCKLKANCGSSIDSDPSIKRQISIGLGSSLHDDGIADG